MLPVILTVYLNDTQQMLTEVPVTPATRVVDVVEYCKEAGEGECHLAEVWNGHERALPPELLLLDLLQRWGARRPEVSFYLRHCPPWPQDGPQLEQSWTTETTESPSDKVDGAQTETDTNKPRAAEQAVICISNSSGAALDMPGTEVLSAEMESLKRHLSQTDSPIVLCHNDLLTKNIIYNSKENMVKFIDYEYADYNYQAFDIGNHFNEFAGVTDVDYSLYPSRELQRDWLTAYLESYKHNTGREVTVTEAEVMQLYIQVCKFSLASNFFWGLWAILQSRFSSIDFDFQRYALMRLNYYFEKKEDYLGLTMRQLTVSPQHERQ